MSRSIRRSRREFVWRSTLGLAGAYSQLAKGIESASAEGVFKGAAQRPTMLLGPDDLPALRKKLSTDPSGKVCENFLNRMASPDGRRQSLDRIGEFVRRTSCDMEEALILRALLSDAPSDKKAAGEAFVRFVRSQTWRCDLVFGGGKIPGRPRVSNRRFKYCDLRYVHWSLHMYDIVASFGVLGEAEDREFRNHIEFVVSQYMRPEELAHNSEFRYRRHNFHTDTLTIIATAALCFPGHPESDRWLRYALEEFSWQMRHSVLEGAWHEVPRYHGFVLSILVPLAYAMRRNSGTDLFSNQGFRSLLDWFVRCQTPRDRVYGSWLRRVSNRGSEYTAYPADAISVQPGVGDSLWVQYWFAVLGMAAAAYKESDPDFAGRLMWGWARAGGPYAAERSDLLKPLILIDPLIEPMAQNLGSERLGPIGYSVLRSDCDRPEEKYLFFTSGPRANVAHKHADCNSFSLYAEGVPLALDAATGAYRTDEHGGWHRATVSHNTVMFGNRSQSRLDGRISTFVTKPGADYVVGDATSAAGVERFHRHILFVKPHYFVVWDSIRSEVPADWLLHSPAEEIHIEENVIVFDTPWGVALDVHFVEPQAPLQIWQGEGRIGNWPAGAAIPPHREPPFRHQKYVRVKNEPGQDYWTVLRPRKIDQHGLTVRRKPGSQVLEVTDGEQRDHILLLPKEADFQDSELDIHMKGRVGIVRNGPKSRELILIDGSYLRHRSRELRA